MSNANKTPRSHFDIRLDGQSPHFFAQELCKISWALIEEYHKVVRDVEHLALPQS
jgi:hypothetical protein